MRESLLHQKEAVPSAHRVLLTSMHSSFCRAACWVQFFGGLYVSIKNVWSLCRGSAQKAVSFARSSSPSKSAAARLHLPALWGCRPAAEERQRLDHGAATLANAPSDPATPLCLRIMEFSPGRMSSFAFSLQLQERCYVAVNHWQGPSQPLGMAESFQQEVCVYSNTGMSSDISKLTAWDPCHANPHVKLLQLAMENHSHEVHTTPV